jgi:hypothetical protein
VCRGDAVSVIHIQHIVLGDGSGTYSSLYGCQTNPFSCCGSLPSIAQPPATKKLNTSNTVQFTINDMDTGLKEAKEKGYNGDEKEVLDIYAKLNGTDGTPNADLGFLKCKKCGGGTGICGKGACIGIGKGNPPVIVITIPI